FAYQVSAPFRLDLRTEPVMTGGPQGRLDTYHDLVTDSKDLAHRLAAVPSRINPALAPVVDAMTRHSQVEALLAEAVTLLPDYAPEDVRHSTLEILRVAAMKGFIQIAAKQHA